MSFWGQNKEELVTEAITWKVKFEASNEQVIALRLQVKQLQDALICKESPEAYRQMQWDKSALENTVAPEKKKKMELQADIEKEWLSNLESTNYLKSADDMIRNLGPSLGVDVEDLIGTLGKDIGINVAEDSLHENSES